MKKFPNLMMRCAPVPVVFIALLLSSCANQSDSNLTRTQGAVTGAVVGSALAKVAGQSNKVTVISAMIGAGAGLIVGDQVAKNKERYAHIEDQLRTVIAAANSATQQSREINQKLAEQILVLKRQKEDLLAETSSRTAQQRTLTAEHEKTRQMIDQTARSMAVLGQQLAEQQRKLSEQKKVLLDQKISDTNNIMVTATTEVYGLDTEQRVLAANLEQLRMIDERRAY